MHNMCNDGVRGNTSVVGHNASVRHGLIQVLTRNRPGKMRRPKVASSANMHAMSKPALLSTQLAQDNGAAVDSIVWVAVAVCVVLACTVAGA